MYRPELLLFGYYFGSRINSLHDWDLRWNHAQALPCSNPSSMDFIGIPDVVALAGNTHMVIQCTSSRSPSCSGYHWRTLPGKETIWVKYSRLA